MQIKSEFLGIICGRILLGIGKKGPLKKIFAKYTIDKEYKYCRSPFRGPISIAYA